MSTLREAASRSGFSFQMGRSGNWLRFEGRQTDVYVMGDTSQNKFSVVQSGEMGEVSVNYYLRAEEAVAAAVRRLS
jgi:hypothetical protein